MFSVIPRNFMFDIDGNIWGRFYNRGEQGVSYTISMADSTGKIIKDIAECPVSFSSFSRGNAITRITHGYEYSLSFSEIDSCTFVYGYSKEYRLNIVRNDGVLLRTLEKDEPQIRFTSNMKTKIRNSFQNYSSNEKNAFKFPDTFPYFHTIFTDNKSRIYVRKIRPPLKDDELSEYDIFSSDGYFLYETKFPKPPRVIKKGYFYTIEIDKETGLEFAKRYKITNWNQLKTQVNNPSHETKLKNHG